LEQAQAPSVPLLELQLADSVKAWRMKPDGSYGRNRSEGSRCSGFKRAILRNAASRGACRSIVLRGLGVILAAFATDLSSRATRTFVATGKKIGCLFSNLEINLGARVASSDSSIEKSFKSICHFILGVRKI
jgi:hypothetical protein